MRAVDANVLVRLLAHDAPAQVAAAESFVAGGAWVSHLVLAEAMWVLAAVYERTPSDLAVAVDMLLSHQHVTVQDGEVVGAALEHFRRRPSVRFSDCLILEVARKAGHLPLGTFNRGLARLPGAERL